MDTLHVKPITYKLNLSDEQLKHMRPFFKVRSGSFSKIIKTIKHPSQGDVTFDDEVRMRQKEVGSVHVELWDRNSSRPENLIGVGEVKYSNLAAEKGKHEEWIKLLDRNNKEVGKALVEINITKVDHNISIDDMFKRSIEEMNKSYRKAIESFQHTFDDLGKKALTSGSEDKEKSKGEGDETQLMNYRRSLLSDTFENIHSMFERTIEDMHNTFESMARDMFERPFSLGGGQESKSLTGSESRGSEKGTGLRGDTDMGKKEIQSNP